MPGPDDVAMRSRLELDAVAAAHRQVLVLILTLLGEDEQNRKVMMEILAQKLSCHDAHEDPGLEADTAFAFERRVDEEFRRILDDARAALGVLGTQRKP